MTRRSNSRSEHCQILERQQSKTVEHRSYEDRPLTANFTKIGETPPNCKERTHVDQPVTMSSIANTLGSHIMKKWSFDDRQRLDRQSLGGTLTVSNAICVMHGKNVERGGLERYFSSRRPVLIDWWRQNSCSRRVGQMTESQGMSGSISQCPLEAAMKLLPRRLFLSWSRRETCDNA